MCNSEDLDVSFAISFILCAQREEEDHRFAPKLHREMPVPWFITVEKAHASPCPLQHLSPKGLTQTVPPLESCPFPPCRQKPSLTSWLRVQGIHI